MENEKRRDELAFSMKKRHLKKEIAKLRSQLEIKEGEIEKLISERTEM